MMGLCRCSSRAVSGVMTKPVPSRVCAVEKGLEGQPIVAVPSFSSSNLDASRTKRSAQSAKRARMDCSLARAATAARICCAEVKADWTWSETDLVHEYEIQTVPCIVLLARWRSHAERGCL
jgi:hypothetical protein